MRSAALPRFSSKIPGFISYVTLSRKRGKNRKGTECAERVLCASVVQPIPVVVMEKRRVSND